MKEKEDYMVEDKERIELEKKIENGIKDGNISRKRYESDDKTFTLIDKVMGVREKYGVGNIIVVALVVLVFYFGFNLVSALNYENVAEKIAEKLITEQVEIKEHDHQVGSELRRMNNPKINTMLTHMLLDLKADRVSILEMHNGKENPTSLPFVYVDMTYEEIADGKVFLTDEYENLNLSKYPFFDYIGEHKLFIGDIDQISEIDKKLAFRIKANDMNFIVMELLETSVEIGFLTISYSEKPKDLTNEQIIAKVNNYSQKLIHLLDLSDIKKLKTKNR